MFQIKSYAKLNLFLEIIAKNEQGYHELESLICFIGIFDIIEFEESDQLILEIKGEKGDILINDDEENIILKTVKLMAKKYDFEPKLKISLTKNIPIGAGIGGGSANSASTILALNKIFNIKATKEDLQKIALEIGCDVPICLKGETSLVKGIGQYLEETDVKKENISCLVVNPNKSLSTKDVFENLEIKNNENRAKITKNNENLLDFCQNRRNDLTKTAKNKMPEIGLILDLLEKQENCQISRMSGSGATCFALFPDEISIEKAYNNVKKEFSDFFVKKTHLIHKIPQ